MKYVSLALLLVLTVVRAQDPLQKRMLIENPSPARFIITDLVWPANHGEGHVCLWADDKLAAVSIGVDDNIQPDHAWWIEMGKKYGFRFTWWVVTSHPESEGQAGFNRFFGNWDDFRLLHAEGHELGSHSVDHVCADTVDSYWDDQMSASNGHIEAAIPGYTVKTYAGPCGKAPSKTTTAKYYVSARGVVGGTNPANNTVYYQTKVNGNFDPACLLTKGNNSWPCYYRGWQVIFYHYLQGNNDTEENEVLIPLYDHRDSIWVGRYCDVARYGQSRDTHTLTVNSVTDSMITFTLTDSMNDTLFDYPLTVKVRLNNDWDTCIATQNGGEIEAGIIEHNSDKYALVKAVPDKGEVVLSKETQMTGIKRLVDSWQLTVDKKQCLFRMNGQRIHSGQKQEPGVYLFYNGKTVKKVVLLK